MAVSGPKEGQSVELLSNRQDLLKESKISPLCAAAQAWTFTNYLQDQKTVSAGQKKGSIHVRREEVKRVFKCKWTEFGYKS